MTNLSTAPKTFCFVLMPFNESFDDIYQLGIKEACNIAGAYSERVDEQNFHETILDRIYNQISKADIVIADMSGRNPNVFYEVGYAHALGKPTILLTKEADDIPFDLKHYPHIIYENKITKLKKALTTKIKWFIENPQHSDREYKTEIDFYIGNKNLSKEKVILEEKIHPLNIGYVGYIEFDFLIHNNSTKTYAAEDISISLITSESFVSCSAQDKQLKAVTLPNKQRLFKIQTLESLFPQEYSKLLITLRPNEKKISFETDEEITIRLFTHMGSRDYSFLLKIKNG